MVKNHTMKLPFLPIVALLFCCWMKADAVVAAAWLHASPSPRVGADSSSSYEQHEQAYGGGSPSLSSLAARCSNHDDQLVVDCSRRRALQNIVCLGRTSSVAAALVLLLDPRVAVAQTETLSLPHVATVQKKPFAPIENLLPAARVKASIDRSVVAAKALQASSDDNEKEELLRELQYLILAPRSSYITKQEASTAKRYLQIDTLNEWTKARQKDAESNVFPADSAASVDPLTRLNEGFEQWGERGQFRRLRRQQIALENINPMRAAFNSYTNNLVFGDTYVLTAESSEKSRMIRQDQLPDVTSVIRSDLDLRDLYRNQILTAMDDARAELKYQLEQMDDSARDMSELVSLLIGAQNSCNNWFDFVPEVDVKTAMQKVLAEEGIV